MQVCLLETALINQNCSTDISTFMKTERESTTAEKIAAAAAVASAAAQTKIAMEATKARKKMEEMSEAVQVAAKRQERIQLAMASEQVENNFRNTVLATLPLLKTEQERIQFLTEQFVPRLKETDEDFIYFPAQWVVESCKKNNAIETYLESKDGEELEKFLSEGKALTARESDYADRLDERNKAQEDLRLAGNPVKKGLLVIVFLFAILTVGILFSGFEKYSFVFAILGPIAVLLGLLVANNEQIKVKQLKSKIETIHASTENRPKISPETASAIIKELDLRDSKWNTISSQIAKHLIEEYNPIITGDARAIISELVASRIEEGVQDYQSFLPPSVRLPASHYAQFLFTEEDVEDFKAEQKDIINLLEKKLKPDYQNETVVLG